MEKTLQEQNKIKRMERTEDSLRDLWDSIKHTNIGNMGESQKKKRKRKGMRKFFKRL